MPDQTPFEPGDADPIHNPGGDGVNVSADEVAQGRSGLQILIVLVVSLALAAIVLFALFGAHAHKNAGATAGGETTVAPADAPKQNPPPQAVDASRGS